MNPRQTTTARLFAVATVALVLLGLFGVLTTFAASTYQINYQGKLTNSSDEAVSDGTYVIRFRIYTASSGGTNLFDETQSVTVTNGLFSVMLGSASTTVLESLDWNQPLYLGVTVSSDTEMTPRKVIGTVPTAFDSGRVGGIASSSFLRADATNSTSTASTFVTFVQSGAGKVMELIGQSSATILSVLSNGRVGLGTTSPNARFDLSGTAGGSIPIFQVSTSTASFATSTALIVDSNGKVGIGTSTPTWMLTVAGDVAFSGNATTSGALVVGTALPTTALAAGDIWSNLIRFSATSSVTGTDDDLIFQDQNAGIKTLSDLVVGAAGCTNANTLISGGIVTYSGSGFTFDVPLTTYCINSLQYQAPSGQVTLADADATGDRIDIVAVNTSSSVVVIQGATSTNPIAPSVDPATHLSLTFVYVKAGATQPGADGAGPIQQKIYLENTEWVGAQTTPTGEVDFDNATDPQQGSKNVEVTTALANGDFFQFSTTSASWNPTGYSTVSFYIKNKTAWTSNNDNIRISFRSTTGSQLGSLVSVRHNTYGFDRTNTSSYQKIAIPLSSFGTLGTSVKYLRFAANPSGSNTLNFRIDNIVIEGTSDGGATPSTGLSGAGLANHIAFWTGSTTLASSANFIWSTSTNRLGIGTTSPYATLSVEGSSVLGNNALAGYFIATSTTASIFPYASTTALTVSGSLSVNNASSTITNLTTVNATSTNATTTTFAISGLTSTLLKTDALGVLRAAVAGVDYVSSLFQNWGLTDGFLTPTTSVPILVNNATSTITNLVTVNATSTNATTSAFYSSGTSAFEGKLLVGTTSISHLRNFVSTNSAGYGELYLIDPTTANYESTSMGGTYIRSNEGLLTFQGMRPSDGSGGGVNFTIDQVNTRVGVASSTPKAALSVDNILTHNSFVVNDEASDATPFVIDASGSTGIRMSSPETALHVNQSASGLGIIVRNVDAGLTGVTGLGFQSIGSETSGYVKGGVLFEQTASSGRGTLHFATDNTADSSNVSIADARLSILASGNIGIGTTTPDVALNINADSTFGSGLTSQIRIAGATDAKKRLLIGFDTTSDYGYIQATQYGTAVKPLALQALGGSVGIGSTSPHALLSVHGAGYISSDLFVGGNIVSTSTTASIFPNASTTNISVSNDLWVSGRVAIGTTTNQSNVEFAYRGNTNDSVVDSVLWEDNYGIHNTITRLSTPTTAGQTLGSITFAANDGTTASNNAARIYALTDGAWTDSSHPAYLTFSTTPSGSTSLTEAMRIDSTGFIGIGTTTPDSLLTITASDAVTNSVTTVQRINHFTSGTAANGFGSRLQFDLEDDGGVQRFAGAIDVLWNSVGTDDSHMVFSTGNGGSEQEVFRITDGGLLLVGTSTAGNTQLDVFGSAEVMQLSIAGTGQGYMDFTNGIHHNYVGFESSVGSGIFGTGLTNPFVIGTDGDRAITFHTNNVARPRLTIDGGGEVGIGTTTPSRLFSVHGAAYISSGLFVGGTVISTTTSASSLPYASSTSFSTSGTTFLSTTDGRVGIGTTSPFASLAVNPIAGKASNAFIIGSSTATRFVVDNSGWVGIGTGDPSFPFDLQTSTSSVASTLGYAARIFNSSTANNAKGLLIQLGQTGYGQTTNIYAGFATSSGSTAFLAGKITGSGGGVTLYTATADFAEYFHIADGYDHPEPGDIVRLIPSEAESIAVTNGVDSAPIGIVSTNPAFIGNAPICRVDDEDCDENHEQYNSIISLAGRTPTKVSLENGPISIGDRIVPSSLPGVGMRASTSAVVVGIALEDFNASSAKNSEGVGKIKVLINLSYYRIDKAISEGNITTSYWTLDENTGSIKALGPVDLNNFPILNVKAIQSASGKWSINENGSLIVEDLAVRGRATIGTPENRTGITLYDEQTGAPYCLSITGGSVRTTAGACDGSTEEVSPSPTPAPSSGGGSTQPPEVSEGETGGDTVGDEPSEDPAPEVPPVDAPPSETPPVTEAGGDAEGETPPAPVVETPPAAAPTPEPSPAPEPAPAPPPASDAGSGGE